MTLPVFLVVCGTALCGGVAGARCASWLAFLARWGDQASPEADLAERADLAGRPVTRGNWWLHPAGAGVVVAIVLACAGISLMFRSAPVVSAWVVWPGLALAWWAASAACLVDAAAHRLPDVLVVRLGGAGIVLAFAAMLAGGNFPHVLSSLGGATAAGVPLALIAFLHPPSMGLGDVKLALLLGAAVGAPLAALATLLIAFLAGGLVAIGVVVARFARRGDSLPFGPLLLFGALIASFGWAAPTGFA